MEERQNANVPVSPKECADMKESKKSMAGSLHRLQPFQESFSTTNSYEVGWGTWPMGMIWKESLVSNCHLVPTKVFARYGSKGIESPAGGNSTCRYLAGACFTKHGTLSWSPVANQQCAYIPMARVNGSYSDGAWLSKAEDFSLTFFQSTSSRRVCGRVLRVAD
jgi:hypothetical protein